METEIAEVVTNPFIHDDYNDLAVIEAQNVVEPTKRDLQIVEEMAAIGCSPKEICGVLKIAPEVLKEIPAAKDACVRGAERAKASLRRLQWKTAQKHPIMQIFLGKQILGQADKVEHRNDDSDINKAKQGFANKLKNIIDVKPTRKSPVKAKRDGTGRSRKVPVADVGEGESTTAIRQLANVVVHGGKRKRKDKVGSGVGKKGHVIIDDER